VKKQVLRTRTAFPRQAQETTINAEGAIGFPARRSSRTRPRKHRRACCKNVSPHAHAHFGYCKEEKFSEGANGFPNKVQAQPEHGRLASTATEMFLDMPMLLPVFATSTLWPDVGLTLEASQKLLRAGERPIPSPVEKR
jgi:hypothetical protein